MIELAFFREDNPSWYVKLIRLRQMGEWHHVGMVIDGVLYEAIIGAGIRARKFVEGPNIKLVPLMIDEEQKLRVRAWWLAHLGAPYDLVGNIEVGLGKSSSIKEAWFCSEACCAACREVGVFTFAEPGRVKPYDLMLMALAREEALKNVAGTVDCG